ncbi:MAG: class I SAM-dependent methyltransferase [Bacillota bacterium]
MVRPTYLELLAKYGINGAHPGGMPLTVELLRNTHINSNTSLLDVGCGAGQTSAFIAKRYRCKVTAVDINEEMLKRSSDKFNREKLKIDLIRANAEDLPFASESFDILLSESVTAFTNINRSLKEYYRVLKQHGTLMAIEITSESSLTSNDLSNIKFVYNIDRVPTTDEWIGAFTKAGFTALKTFRVAVGPTNRITSIGMLMDFFPHIRILQYYRKKLGYRVFICKKQ